MGTEIVRTVCEGCMSGCGVLVHRENGRVTGIAGDPDHPHLVRNVAVLVLKRLKRRVRSPVANKQYYFQFIHFPLVKRSQQD